MGDKNKTISFRVTEDKFEDLKQIAEEEEKSLSDLLRGSSDNILDLYEIADQTESSTTDLMDKHVRALENDDFYRETVDAFYQDGRDFQNFVSDEEIFDTTWVDETKVDYDMMFENFQEVVYQAERHNFDEAEEIIDDLKSQGYDQEAYLLNSVTSKYRE